MANRMRWRYGDTKPRFFAVDSATVVEIGDLVWLDTDDVKPASSVTDQGTEAANQEYFHDRFAGVAMQQSTAGDTAPLRVATSGVFEFDSLAATYEIGGLVGVDEATSGTALEDQQAAAVATENLALGRVAERAAVATTAVRVEIVATVSHGGPQAFA